MLRLLYYATVGLPIALLRSLVADDLMVLVGLKRVVPTGRPVWRKLPK